MNIALVFKDDTVTLLNAGCFWVLFSLCWLPMFQPLSSNHITMLIDIFRLNLLFKELAY